MGKLSKRAVNVQHSVWTATSQRPEYFPLTSDIQADVVVVGAGIFGLSTAYMLAKSNQSVVVLDDGPIGGGVTEVTTAHLSTLPDVRYSSVEKTAGEQGARLCAESLSASIQRIESNIRREKIDCDFVRLDGYLFAGPGGSQDDLDREMAAAHRAGLSDVVKVKRAPLGSFDTGPCLLFPGQARFHPLRYLTGLARGIERLGGRIFCGSHVDRIDGGSRVHVEAGAYMVSASAVVVATNTPVNETFSVHTKQAPYMSYVICAPIQRGAAADALFWDTEEPFHYVRLQPATNEDEPDMLIVGGEDHKTGQASDGGKRHARLEMWARERFPSMGEVRFRWAGQVMQTLDGLAFIGKNSEDNVYIATGDSGMGMTQGTIAGVLLRDLILGRENPWASLYDPKRKPLRAMGTMAKENLNAAVQYTDWLTGGDVGSKTDVPKGSGAVVRRGLRKVAIYRDEAGQVHECSAVCPHLGCIVKWDGVEKSWDCPCHGSRFDPYGKVLNGPANQDLTKADGS